MTDWREPYKPGDLAEVRHTHTLGGENDWSRVPVRSAGEDEGGRLFVETDMNGLGFRVFAPENIRIPCGPRAGEVAYDGVTQKRIRKVTP